MNMGLIGGNYSRGDRPALLADLDGASNPAPFSDSACPCLSEASFVHGWTYAAEARDGRERLGQALKKGPDSRK
jgi:hypothetical protein